MQVEQGAVGRAKARPGQAVSRLILLTMLTMLCFRWRQEQQRFSPTEAQTLGKVNGDGSGMGTAADGVENSEKETSGGALMNI